MCVKTRQIFGESGESPDGPEKAKHEGGGEQEEDGDAEAQAVARLALLSRALAEGLHAAPVGDVGENGGNLIYPFYLFLFLFLCKNIIRTEIFIQVIDLQL
jgi:hypothetical protein